MDAPPVPAGPLVELVPDPAAAPPPDLDLEPAGYVVEADDGTRLHFLDWGDPPEPDGGPAVLLVPGLARTARSWSAVARRLARRRRVVAADARGHGLSDAPPDGYDGPTAAGDMLAVTEAAGFEGPIVLVGHGFGAIVAVHVAAADPARIAALVLVDGGWESLSEVLDLDADEFLRTLEEPPEVLRSMDAWLADRRSFDEATWDADAERAARDEVVETAAGRVVPAIHPHALAATVRAMFAYDPVATLVRTSAHIVAVAARDDEAGRHLAALEDAAAALHRADPARRPIAVARFPHDGHDLPRRRAAAVATVVLDAHRAPTMRR